ncbi:unnamed protein product [Oppiella nova]|uniref:OTU domain-containing protein n=1 Tax=Oppiella nova TaxID=334625 RepID=A0A7R9L8P1_9ACAR|nr:unnamed protein product [Oppiella nova]CAG2159705.1 unnamed protein product [Oppiella nova]
MNERSDQNESKREEILERHRLERKQLNAKTTEMRHKCDKKDKKKAKDLKTQIETMTEELKTRHENELKDLSVGNHSGEEAINRLTDELNDVKVETNTSGVSEDTEVIANGMKYKETKISRAQRRRDAKSLKDKQREQRIADDMVDDADNHRLIEAQQLKNILDSRGLTVYEIASDGDCMYRSIEHQLSLKNIKTNVTELRQKTCHYMKENKIDFIPFLTSNTTGDLMNDSEYELYCEEVADTKSWGGQLELRAISHVFKMPIEVIQTVGNPVLIGQTDYKTDTPLILW